jgi:hypothetical protein
MPTSTPRLLERGIRWLRDKAPDAAAVEVEVRAGNQVIERLDAIPGRRDFQQYLVEDFAGTDEIFDWIVVEQDLIFGGVKKQPEDGWEIRYRTEGGSIGVYVAMPGTGTRCFDVLDQLGLLYRVHTKLDRIEAGP